MVPFFTFLNYIQRKCTKQYCLYLPLCVRCSRTRAAEMERERVDPALLHMLASPAQLVAHLVGPMRSPPRMIRSRLPADDRERPQSVPQPLQQGGSPAKAPRLEPRYALSLSLFLSHSLAHLLTIWRCVTNRSVELASSGSASSSLSAVLLKPPQLVQRLITSAAIPRPFSVVPQVQQVPVSSRESRFSATIPSPAAAAERKRKR